MFEYTIILIILNPAKHIEREGATNVNKRVQSETVYVRVTVKTCSNVTPVSQYNNKIM